MRIGRLTLFTTLFILSGSASAEPLRIGATVPLTGGLATYGNLIRGGIELAAEDLRADGIETKLFFEDTPLSGAGTVTAAKKLVELDKVQGVAGNFSNVAMASTAPVFENAQVPVFHTAATDQLILESPKFVFSTNVRIRDEATHLAEYLYTKKAYRRVGVITIETNFGESYRDYFVDRFKALGGSVTGSESFTLTDGDYRIQLSKIRASKPEVIFGACFGPFLGNVLKQSRELGIIAPFYSVYESEDQSVVDTAGDSANGLRYFVTFDPDSVGYRELTRRFKERYMTVPGTFGANAFDATLLLGRALSRCNADPKCTVENLYETKVWPGASGTITIDSDGASTKRFILREITSGEFRTARD